MKTIISDLSEREGEGERREGERGAENGVDEKTDSKSVGLIGLT